MSTAKWQNIAGSKKFYSYWSFTLKGRILRNEKIKSKFSLFEPPASSMSSKKPSIFLENVVEPLGNSLISKHVTQRHCAGIRHIGRSYGRT